MKIKLISAAGIAALLTLSSCHHHAGDAAVIQVAKAGYDALAVGDMDAWASTQGENVTWRLPKGLPYGGDHIGAQTVIDGVFGPIKTLWPDFKVEALEFHASGNVVFIEARITAGGQTSDALHRGVIANGKFTEFQAYDDSAFLMRHASASSTKD